MQFPYIDSLTGIIVLAATLTLPALTLLLTLWHHERVTHGKIPVLRPLMGVTALEQRMSDMIESGRPLHIATGANQPGNIGLSAETLASISLAQRLAEAATQQGGTVIVTSGDVMAHTAVRGTVREAYRHTGLAAEYRGREPQLVAHQAPLAYATAVARRYVAEPMDASVVAGDIGTEGLLMTAEGAGRIPQVAGATALTALPGLILSSDAVFVGEELFAAEAYFATTPAPTARLLTHDMLRWTIIGLLLAGMAYQIVNIAFGLGLPSL